MSEERVKRKLSAILSADVVGYSRLMGEDEVSTVRTLEAYRKVMSDLIEQFRGRVVDSPGDNLLSEFSSVVDAVQCAVEIHDVIRAKNEELPENRRMLFRIGVNLGDVIEEGDRIYGDGVNIAARLEGLAEAGGICISGSAHEQIENKLALGYEFLGEHTVKNIAKPVKVYKVPMGPKAATSKEGDEKKSKLKNWQWVALGVVGTIIVIIAAMAIWNFYSRGPYIEPASVERMAYPLPDKPSIAVLPFRNMSGDPEQDYIGDGLSENITSSLSKIGGMFVIARESVFIYKEKPTNVQKVAEELGIQYVLEGSIQKSGDRLRITAQLIDALSGYHLWSEKYDRKMEELFDLQDEITKKIVVSLEVALTRGGEAIIESRDTDNLEAWSKVAQGYNLWLKMTKEDNKKARRLFEEAVELDPDYATAWAWIGWSYVYYVIMGWSESPSDSLKHASEAGLKALEIDDRHPYVFSLQGKIHFIQKQYDEAISKVKEAIAIDPSYYGAYYELGEIMHFLGRFEESIELNKEGIRHCPMNPRAFLYYIGRNYFHLGRYEEAISTLNQADNYTARNESLSLWITLAYSQIYSELGKEEEARAYMAEALKSDPNLSSEYIKDLSPFKNPTHLQRELDALRKAGLPEKPPGVVQEKPSIAVLPFDDLSPEKDQEYFVLGLSEEILNSLTQIRDLTVIAKTSSFYFKDKDKTFQEIANALDVEYILEGSVRKSGNFIRINAQLIKTEDESHLWSETYDKDLGVKELFDVQEDIANNVADKLKLTLEAFNLLGGTESVGAYELYLKAKAKMVEGGSVYKSVLALIDEAIDLDPKFALAWTFKSFDHIVLSIHGPFNRSMKEADAATKAAQRAIGIEPNLGGAYFYLATMKSMRGEWIEAERNYHKALELMGESLSGDNIFIAVFYSAVGNFERVFELLDEMNRNDPINQNFSAWYYFSYGLLGDRQRAEKKYQRRNRSMTKGNSDWHDTVITETRIRSGDVLSADEIISSNQIHVRIKEYIDSPDKGLMELRRIYNGDDNLSSSDFGRISLWAAYFGDYEFAMEAVEKSYSTDAASVFGLWFPLMKEVRQLPRFKKFVREIGLVDYWKEFGWPDLCRPVGDDDFVCD